MHDGLHIFEDAFIVQVVDPETGEPMPDGELGSLCVTELYKTGSPQFRYNIMDLSYLYPAGSASAAAGCARWARSPVAATTWSSCGASTCGPRRVGEIACAVDGVAPDYFVRAVRRSSRDELIISVVSDRDPSTFEEINDEIERRLQGAARACVIAAEVVRPGELDDLTEIHTSPKPKRFRDDRTREPMTGVVDYLCNAFTPDRESVWDDAIAAQGVPIKVRRDPTRLVRRRRRDGRPHGRARHRDRGARPPVTPSHHGTTFEYDPVASSPASRRRRRSLAA